MLVARKRHRCQGGWVYYYSHPSDTCRAQMNFSIFLPPKAEHSKVPALYWLSGLTCTDENFMTKAGAQKFAAEKGIALICPDTSPRQTGIENENQEWDLGTGASFYVNATTSKWSKHFQMYDYTLHELPELISRNFPIDVDRRSVFGHSMGGHGALILALKNPGVFQSVSAFSPIVAPTLCPWGQKAFSAYLGNDTPDWEEYDAHKLILKTKTRLPLLIDQGSADEFLENQLMTSRLEESCRSVDYPLELHYRDGYDHSYYFISSFIGNHILHHAKALDANS